LGVSAQTGQFVCKKIKQQNILVYHSKNKIMNLLKIALYDPFKQAGFLR